MNDKRPIGVFDSGIGGLSVVKAIGQKLPHENIVYFGDIARLPYGTKSVSTIKKFTEQTVKFLLKQDVKAIVIACNTITAVAKDVVLQLAGNLPVIDVIESGVLASINCEAKHIGVIATPATINSNAYSLAIHKLNPEAEVSGKACPLFVPMIEEGFAEHPAMQLVVDEYLHDLDDDELDCLILGCTHYPLIKKSIAKAIASNVKIIDPAEMSCELLEQRLSERHLLNTSSKLGTYKFYVTDLPMRFQEIGERFLNRKMDGIELVSVE